MKFVLFSLLEMRYMLVVWRASRGSRADMQWEEARRGLGILYFRFCMCSCIGLQVCLIMPLRIYRWVSHRWLNVFLSNSWIASFLFICVMFSFWIPQIVSNVLRNSRHVLSHSYILGMTLTRLLIPFYYYGCPQNLLGIEQNWAFLLFLTVYCLLQAFILYLQDRLGPRAVFPDSVGLQKLHRLVSASNYRRCSHHDTTIIKQRS